MELNDDFERSKLQEIDIKECFRQVSSREICFELAVAKVMWAYRLAGCDLLLLLRLSCNGWFQCGVGRGIAWGRVNNSCGACGVGKRGGRGWIDQGSDQVRGRNRWRLKRLMMIEHPSGQHRFAAFLNPLVDEGGDFVAKVGGVVESGQFKALQGRT